MPPFYSQNLAFKRMLGSWINVICGETLKETLSCARFVQYEIFYFVLNSVSYSQGGYFHIKRSGGLAPKLASEILVGAPNFASKNIGDKYHKFCPLNFRFDPKIGIFQQLLRYVITELPKFFLLFGELGRTLPQISPPNLIRGPSPPPPDLLIWK